MENLIVILIVVLAGVYISRTFFKRLRKREADVCGCSSCEMNAGCSELEKETHVSVDDIVSICNMIHLLRPSNHYSLFI
jgi:hypothetical protein